MPSYSPELCPMTVSELLEPIVVNSGRFFDFNSPSLIIGQMPMKTVDIV